MKDVKWNFETMDMETDRGDVEIISPPDAFVQRLVLRLRTPYFFSMLEYDFGSDMVSLVNSPDAGENDMIRVLNESLLREPIVKDFNIDGETVEVLLESGEVINVQVS